MILDCSKAVVLANVPDTIPDKVVVINLSNNALAKLNNDSFSNCTNVAKLDLSNNKISVIRNAMLKSMPNLEVIVLDQNIGFSYNNLTFPDDSFRWSSTSEISQLMVVHHSYVTHRVCFRFAETSPHVGRVERFHSRW